MPSDRPIRRNKPSNKPTPKQVSVRAFSVATGLPTVTQMMVELQDMTDVLLGREEPPIDVGVMTLYEVADAYYARASEMTMLILSAERQGLVSKGSGHYRFRTGELRTFMEMAKRSADLGSRRVTAVQLELLRERTGRES